MLWALGSWLWALGVRLWALGSGQWVLGYGFWVLGFGRWAVGGSELWARHSHTVLPQVGNCFKLKFKPAVHKSKTSLHTTQTLNLKPQVKKKLPQVPPLYPGHVRRRCLRGGNSQPLRRGNPQPPKLHQKNTEKPHSFTLFKTENPRPPAPLYPVESRVRCLRGGNPQPLRGRSPQPPKIYPNTLKNP